MMPDNFKIYLKKKFNKILLFGKKLYPTKLNWLHVLTFHVTILFESIIF